MAVSRDLYELGQLRDLRVTSPLRHGPRQTLAERCFSEASTLQRSVIVQTALSPEGAAANKERKLGSSVLTMKHGWKTCSAAPHHLLASLRTFA